MDMNYYKQYEPIFGSWRIVRKLGEGSFGKVYEIEREDFGVTYKAALKAITVPASETELRDVMADGMDEAGAREYYHSFVQDLVREFALMSRLKGNSNVVSYENHQVIEHKDGIGWDILIQMELLTPLNEYIRTTSVTRQDIIKLGIDMCKALELCQKFNIIHRDVKPENIFVSQSGDFKLGDFGIARTVEKTTSGLSKKGTYTYMAPEVYKGEDYGSTVDIYSLGVVLYRLLNENRTPFLPAYPAPITHSDRENALAKRFSGAPLPPPVHAEGRLAEIVLKACAYDPKQRYNVPLRMRQELEAILYNREESRYIYPEGDEAPQHSVQYVRTGDEPPVSQNEPTQKDDGPGLPPQERTVGQFESTVVDTERTVSDFGTVKQPKQQKPAGRQPKPAAKPERKSKPAKPKKGKAIRIIAAVLAVAVAGFIGFGVWSDAQAEKKQMWLDATITAERMHENGDFADCEEFLRSELSAYPEIEKNDYYNARMNAILASACFEQSKFEAAAEIYYDLLQQQEENNSVAFSEMGGRTVLLRDYAVCLARLGRMDEAAAVFVMLTDSGADEWATNYVLGETYYAKGEYENAAKAFESARYAAIDPRNVEKADEVARRCYVSLAETYRELNDYDASIEIIELAVQRRDLLNNAAMYEMLGAAYYQRGLQTNDHDDYMGCAQAFKQAIQLGLQKAYMYVNAAIGYLNAEVTSKPSGWAGENGFDYAIEMMDEMEAVYPNRYEPYAMRAIIHIYRQNTLELEQRDYTYAYDQYLSAKDRVTANDDQVHLQMLESYIQELRNNGWL